MLKVRYDILFSTLRLAIKHANLDERILRDFSNNIKEEYVTYEDFFKGCYDSMRMAKLLWELPCGKALKIGDNKFVRLAELFNDEEELIFLKINGYI